MMLGRVTDRVVKDVPAKPLDLSIRLQRLVYVVASPAGAPTVIEPALMIWPPAGMLDPAAEIKREPGHLESRALGLGAAFEFFNLVGELFGDSLIRIEAEDPIVAG